MAEIQKINVCSAVNKPLALSRQGSMKVSEVMEKLQVSDKVKMVKEHPVATKVVDKATQFGDVLWAMFGLTLILHGAQFKNLFLCITLIKAFYYDRVTSSITAFTSSFNTAMEKIKADAPDTAEADAKAEPKNKHAAKRDEKNKPKASSEAEDAAAAKKCLKALDSKALSNTAFELFSAAMACHMVMHTHLGQAIVLAHDLVKVTKEKLDAILDFAGLEDLAEWTDIFVKCVLYFQFFGLAIIAAPLALAFDVSSLGARFALENGLKFAQSLGKIPDAEAFLASKKGLIALVGLTAFGTLWQFWSLMAASGIAWYFKMFYFPALIAETIVGCF